MSVMSIEEMRVAYRAGLARSDAARRRGGKHVYGGFPLGPEAQRKWDAESAVAEALVARTLDREWLSDGLVPDKVDVGDVAGGLSVRWTERPNGSLILHPEDPDELIGVLVVGVAPEQRVAGWIPVADGKREELWRTDVRYPAFFVPQRLLRTIEELR